jgi:serine acetyltransferase
MINNSLQPLLEQRTTPFVATLEELQRLRFEFLLKNPEWIKLAHKNDPALDKYEKEYNISVYAKEHPEAFENWLVDQAKEHTVLKEYLENQETHDAMHTLLSDYPEVMELESYPGLTVIAAHIKAHELYMQAQKAENPFDALSDFAAARRLSEVAKSVGGGDIHPGASFITLDEDKKWVLHHDVFIDHVSGGVIGETAIIGKGCFLLHGVTLGGSGQTKEDDRVVGRVRRHPALGDRVRIGSNANIYGACDIADDVVINTGATIIDCTIGEGAKIGAGVLLRGVTVPPHAEIYDVGQPKLAVYNPDYQGVVTVRGKDQSPKDYFANDEKKSALASDFIAKEDVAAAILRPEDIALMREANAFIAQWKDVVQQENSAQEGLVRH